jgi:ABC-type phosphate transport system substrate-binding protein
MRGVPPAAIRRALALALIASTALLAPGAPRGQPAVRDSAPLTGPIAVIVHPTNRLANLSRGELRSIFLRHRSSWAGGADPILMLNWPPRHPIRVRFDKAVLGLSPDEAAAYWIDRRIRGQGLPPRSTASTILLVAIVARNREAIAYVPLASVTRQVKVLRVDGLPPGQPSYPLRAPERPR